MVNTPHSQQVVHTNSLPVNSCLLSWMSCQYFCSFPHNSSASPPCPASFILSRSQKAFGSLTNPPNLSSQLHNTLQAWWLVLKMLQRCLSSQQPKQTLRFCSHRHLSRLPRTFPLLFNAQCYKISRNVAPLRALLYRWARAHESKSVSGERGMGG